MDKEPTLGQFLQRKRLEKNVSLEHAAVKIGIDRSGLGKIEKDQVSPREATLTAILEYYDSSREELEKFQNNGSNANLAKMIFDQVGPDAENQYIGRFVDNIRFLLDLGLSTSENIEGIQDIVSEHISKLREIESDVQGEMDAIKDDISEDDDDGSDGSAQIMNMGMMFFGLVKVREAKDRLDKCRIAASRMSPNNYHNLLEKLLEVATDKSA